MAGAWRPANSLVTLRDQINQRWPNRSRISDGMIGDAAHAATKSEHNPNSAGVVTAFDITHDPANGPDIAKLAEMLIASGDPRIWYIIANRRIWEGGRWSVYNGSDPHTNHLHLSVNQAAASYDNAALWNLNNAQGGDEMIQNTQADWSRYWRLHRQVTGYELPKSRFDRDFVGQPDKRGLDLISNNAQADQNTYFADIGRRALGPEDWPKQIRDWRALAEKLAAQLAEKGETMSPEEKAKLQAKIDELAQAADDLEQGIKALKEQEYKL